LIDSFKKELTEVLDIKKDKAKGDGAGKKIG